jgi:hypothetical protein
MSQVLGAFGLLDFTMLRPVLVWRAFRRLWNVYFFNFNFFGPLWNAGTESVHNRARMYAVNVELCRAAGYWDIIYTQACIGCDLNHNLLKHKHCCKFKRLSAPNWHTDCDLLMWNFTQGWQPICRFCWYQQFCLIGQFWAKFCFNSLIHYWVET